MGVGRYFTKQRKKAKQRDRCVRNFHFTRRQKRAILIWPCITYTSAMGTMANPWYASTRKAREETKEYAWKKPLMVGGGVGFSLESNRDTTGSAVLK